MNKKRRRSNKIIIFPFLIIVSLFQNCQIQVLRNDIDFITIRYVDIATESPIRIDCNTFEKSFANLIDTLTINNRRLISNINNELKRLQKIDTNYYQKADTRIKIILHLKNKTISVVCLDNLVVEYENITYKNNDKFRKLISSLLQK